MVRKEKPIRKNFKNVYTGLMFLFLYAPIIVLIIYSFNAGKTTAHWGGFSLKWYQALFSDRQIMKSLYYTLLVALGASALATVIGTFAAFGISHMRPLRQKVVMQVNNIPILNPDIVTGVALMTLFSMLKFKLGFSTMLIAHVTFCIPYVILSVLPKLRLMNQDTLNAALDLGATPWYAFRKVIIPEIMPGIISGFLMAFTLSIDDFVISFFTTGGGVSNLSITIYSMARRGIKPIINALSTLMFIAVLVMLLIINKGSDNKQMLDKSR